jgi:hypothetical protein
LSTFDEQPESADKDPYLAHAAAMHGDILQLTRLAKIYSTIKMKMDGVLFTRPVEPAIRM